SRTPASTSPKASSSRSDSARVSSRSCSSRSLARLWMAAILLQNMVAISSRACTRAVWISAATSARFFSGAYRRRSAASVPRASPAKGAALAGGPLASQWSAAPRESSQARCLRWSLTRCTDAAGATVFEPVEVAAPPYRAGLERPVDHLHICGGHPGGDAGEHRGVDLRADARGQLVQGAVTGQLQP